MHTKMISYVAAGPVQYDNTDSRTAASIISMIIVQIIIVSFLCTNNITFDAYDTAVCYISK